MSLYRPPRIAASEITPQSCFFSRRSFLAAAAGGAIAAVGTPAFAEALKASKSRYMVDETPPMPTPSWTVSSTTPIASNSAEKA
jgi:sulfoxide reductase catalytic subunit YedY